jgi:hypothetical protein
MPKVRGDAPGARITLYARYVPFLPVRVLTAGVKSISVMVSLMISAPKCWAWAANLSVSSGPVTPPKKPG